MVLFQGHPSWLSTPGLYVRGVLIALLTGVVAGLASAIIAGGRVHRPWVAVAVALVFMRVGVKAFMRRARTTYTITDRRVTVRVGLVTRCVRETRLDHVVDVDARQTPIERLLRLGTVQFDTGDGRLVFRGISEPHDVARTIARALANRC
jgi:uncharacterized membrane protein YdbT with pleckstrin-like domain